MNKYDETTVEQQLLSIGLPDDFPEIALSGEPEPALRTLERIKSKTLSRTFGKQAGFTKGKRSRRTAWWKTAAAVLLVLLLAAAVLGGAEGGRVWAGLQKAFGLVPGFGAVDQDHEGFTLVSLDQVRAGRESGYVQLAGLLAQPDATYVKLFFKDLAGYTLDVDSLDFDQFYASWKRSEDMARRIYLADEQGAEYRMKKKAKVSWSFSDNRYSLQRDVITYFTLQLPPLPEQIRRATLFVPVEEGPDLELTVNLLPLAEAAEQIKNIRFAEVNGVRVTAGAHFGAETWVSLAVDPPHKGAQLLGINCFSGGRAELTGSKGGWYPMLRSGQTWKANFMEQFHKQVIPGETEVTLSFKIIQFQDQAKTRVKLPIPQEGFESLNIPVSLGRFNFTVTGVESQYYRDGKRLIFHVRPDQGSREIFYGFFVSTGFLKLKGIGGHCGRSESGEMKYSIPVKESRSSITLTLHDPIYCVEGPWSFTFPVDTSDD